MKIFITGSNGFVGNYLIEELLKNDFTNLFGLDRNGSKNKEIIGFSGDLRNREEVFPILSKVQPDIVFHLAGQAFVPSAIEDPQETLLINVKGTLNLLDTLYRIKKKVIFVYISSADVYGNKKDDEIPIKEDSSPNPLNPYSSSKLSAEIYCKQYNNFSETIDIRIARPFNHIGVGQKDHFVVPNFCKQIKSFQNDKKNTIHVGDLSAIRDFLDVTDVVKAYLKIGLNGVRGETYNVCSGEEISIEDVLNKIIKISGKDIQIKQDVSRIRNVDTKRLVGDNKKIKNLGWKKEMGIDESILKIYSSINAQRSSAKN